ncbi:MAG: hypothetical protein FIB07_02620 [Candidatus Methanoperedens sp.]|nr:hypothetical protein [Candidatus Methanoperedens sp.]
MYLKGKIIELFNSRKTIKYLSYWFAFTLTLDVITTAFELTFIRGTREKNPIAYYLIQNFEIVPGLMISVLIELIFWVLLYIGLKTHLLIISIKIENKLDIPNTSGIIVLLIAFVFHIKGVVNNLKVLFAS